MAKYCVHLMNFWFPQPEVLRVVLSADWFMVLQLFKNYRTATGRGGALFGLGRSQWALLDLAARQKAHKSGPSLFSHGYYLW